MTSEPGDQSGSNQSGSPMDRKVVLLVAISGLILIANCVILAVNLSLSKNERQPAVSGKSDDDQSNQETTTVQDRAVERKPTGESKENIGTKYGGEEIKPSGETENPMMHGHNFVMPSPPPQSAGPDRFKVINPNQANMPGMQIGPGMRQMTPQALLRMINAEIKGNPTNFQARMQRSTIYFGMNKFRESIQDLDYVLERQPDLMQAYGMRANAYLQMGELDGAIKDCDLAFSYNPQDPLGNYVKGACYQLMGRRALRTGESQKARKLFLQALEFQSKNIQADLTCPIPRSVRAMTYVLLGQYDKATADCKDALAISPQMSTAHHVLGWTYLMKGDPDAALPELRTAIGFMKSDPDAYTHRGDCYAAMKKFKLARRDYDDALKLRPFDEDALLGRAKTCVKLRDFGTAIADAGYAIRLNPKNYQAYAVRGDAYLGLGQFKRAIAECDSSVKLIPNYSDAIFIRGEAHAGSGDHKAAIADYNKAIAMKQNNPDWLVARARSYIAVGKINEAQKDIDKVIAVKKDFAPAYYALSLLDLSKHDNHKALESANRAVSIDPANVEYLVHRGGILRSLGKDTEASLDFDQALTLDPKYAPARSARADILAKKGEKTQAIAELDKVIQSDPLRNAKALEKRAELGAARGDVDQSIIDLNAAQRLKSGEKSVTDADAKALKTKIASYDQSIEFNPNDATLFYNRGLLNLSLGAYQKSATDLERFISLNKSGISTEYGAIFLSFAYRKLGKSEKAARVLRQAKSRNKAQDWPLPIIEYLQGELSADDLLKQCVSKEKRTRAHTYMGIDYSLKGDRAKALEHLSWVMQQGERSLIDECTLASAEVKSLRK